MSARKRNSATGGCEYCAQPLPVFEQAPCRGVLPAWRSAAFACAAYLLPISSGSTYPAGRESLIDDAPFERRALPSRWRAPRRRGHQPAAGHNPTPVPSVKRHAFGVVATTEHSPSAKAAASCYGRTHRTTPAAAEVKRHPRRAVDALELPHADQRKCPARSRERSGKVAKPAHRAIDARDAATVRRVFAERRRRAGPAAASTLSVLISHTVARGEVSTAEQNMAAADVHAPRAAATATLTNKDEISLETLSGIKPYKSFQGVTTGKVKSARVDMGAPVLSGREIPRCLTATRLWVRRCTSAARWAIKSLRAFQWAIRIALPMWTT